MMQWLLKGWNEYFPPFRLPVRSCHAQPPTFAGRVYTSYSEAAHTICEERIYWLSEIGDIQKIIANWEHVKKKYPERFEEVDFLALADHVHWECEHTLANNSELAQATFVFTPLQNAIWKALDKRALKKQPLADEACASDGGRLYKPGGIKELIAVGKVQHKYGVGYFRPDAPPDTCRN